jgi:hypothetical protein
MVAKEINQIIQLADGQFSPADARDILHELTNSRVNYHNIQCLRMWEGNHHFDSNNENKQIDVLKKEKMDAIALIAKAQKEGYDIQITGNIEVRLSK